MSVTAFHDRPLADRAREGDGDAADERVRRWADAAAVMQCPGGGVDLPACDVDRVKSHLATCYAKMDETASWGRD